MFYNIKFHSKFQEEDYIIYNQRSKSSYFYQICRTILLSSSAEKGIPHATLCNVLPRREFPMRYTLFHTDSVLEISRVGRGGSRAAGISKMDRFEIIVDDFQPSTIITKCSILNVAAALDPPLVGVQRLHQKIKSSCIQWGLPFWCCFRYFLFMRPWFKCLLGSRQDR